jgi:DNA-binding transcriptional regulator/RsmH inhibitor MraZ
VCFGVLSDTDATVRLPVITSTQRYTGFHPYKMDSKFRVSVPTPWRPAAGEGLYLLFSRAFEMPLIKVLSQEAFDHRVKIVEDSALSPAKKAAKLGSLAMLSREAGINDQGKLLIPKELSEKAGIAADSEVILAGRGLHFEVWNKASHERLVEIEMNQDDDDELGIL